MKKIVSVLICLVLTVCVFAACSNGEKKNNDAATTTVAASAHGQVSKIAVDDAVIKEQDAVSLIKSYSAKELSLSDDDMKKVSFLVNSSGKEIEGDKYIMVIAAIKNSTTDKDGTVHVTLDHKGEYYIRYDGKKILKKDMKKTDKDEYSEMKVKAVPTTKAPKAGTTAAATTQAETTKK